MAKRVLVVEDNELNLKLFCDLLRAHGHETRPVSDGRMVLDEARAFHPDLIIMDVMMPGIDGLEATKRIRTIKNLQQVPIIALTALAMSGDRERCIEAGMTDYMSKPIQMQKLAKMLTLHLNPLQDVR